VEEVHQPGLEGGKLPVQLGGHLEEEIILSPLLIRHDLSRKKSDHYLGKHCYELQDEIVDPNNPEQVVECWNLLWWNKECTEAEVFIQEDKIDEENASNKIDRDGNESSQVPPGLPGNLLLEDRVSMEEGEDQATADNDPCPMLEHRLHKDDQKKGDIFFTSRNN